MTRRICSIHDCGGTAMARGWCQRHYSRWRTTGDPLTPSNRGHTVEERLKRRLDATPSGCWEFRGGHKPGTHPYGQLKVDGRMVTTHRLAYELWNGPIPDGAFVCHTCDNPPCCNPEHLFLGTHNDNMADMHSKGRENIDGLLVPRPSHGELIRAGQIRRRVERARAAGVPDDWKRCPGCSEWKPRGDYAVCRKMSDGLQSYCQPCMTLKVRAWRQRVKGSK